MIGNTIPFKRAVIRLRLFIFPSRKKKTVDRVLGLSTPFDVSKYHKARVVSESGAVQAWEHDWNIKQKKAMPPKRHRQHRLGFTLQARSNPLESSVKVYYQGNGKRP